MKTDLTFLITKPTIPVEASTSFVYLGPSRHSRVPLNQDTVGNGLPSIIASMKSFEPSVTTLFSGFSIKKGANVCSCVLSLSFVFRSVSGIFAIFIY